MKYSIPGIRYLDKTAAEIYQVKDDYRRFNQKYNMIWQPQWKNDYLKYGFKERNRSLYNRIRKSEPGFSVLDWAYLCGSKANYLTSDFPINLGNQRGNSWARINPRLPEDIEGWQGSREESTKVVRKVGLDYGADMIGICKLDRRWIYSHYFDPGKKQDFPICFSDQGFESTEEPAILEDGTAVIPADMKYVVVILQEMDQEGIRTAPTTIQMAATQLVYSKISFTAASIAEFIRGLGFKALPAANDTALNIPLAVDAGLGQLGRNAKLINPRYGSMCRISKVITDLPLLPDRPIDFGVTEYCQTCKICAEKCPPRAIPEGDRCYEPAGDFSHSTVLQWPVNHGSCKKYQASIGTNCGLCLATCPYNQKGFKHWFGTALTTARNDLLNRMLTGVAKLPGRLPLVAPEEFWQ